MVNFMYILLQFKKFWRDHEESLKVLFTKIWAGWSGGTRKGEASGVTPRPAGTAWGPLPELQPCQQPWGSGQQQEGVLGERNVTRHCRRGLGRRGPCSEWWLAFLWPVPISHRLNPVGCQEVREHQGSWASPACKPIEGIWGGEPLPTTLKTCAFLPWVDLQLIFK